LALVGCSRTEKKGESGGNSVDTIGRREEG